jgi:DNA-binding ferritin-like protein
MPEITTTTPLPALQRVLAILRAQHWFYYSQHWQATNYQSHLLFQRLYESLPEQFDGLAEKLVGLFGKPAVDALPAMQSAVEAVAAWATFPDQLQAALQSESDLRGAILSALESVADNPGVGLDNFLRGVIDDHETNWYLLRQAQGG